MVRPLAYLGLAAGLTDAFSLPRGAELGLDEADAEIGRRIAEALGAGRGCDAADPKYHADLSTKTQAQKPNARICAHWPTEALTIQVYIV